MGKNTRRVWNPALLIYWNRWILTIRASGLLSLHLKDVVLMENIPPPPPPSTISQLLSGLLSNSYVQLQIDLANIL